MALLGVGTGAGETACVLVHRLGGRHVTTVDLHKPCPAAPVNACAGTVQYVTTVIGDGRDGCPATAPYGRLLATCAVPAAPPHGSPDPARRRDRGVLRSRPRRARVTPPAV
ncbi:methyltransferase domain-containing protein [Streptomyces violascens]|uniref:hypothetical protein n=1 Tax=Streptomyces violascens TaxID=67381 RepID=UPI0036650242